MIVQYICLCDEIPSQKISMICIFSTCFLDLTWYRSLEKMLWMWFEQLCVKPIAFSGNGYILKDRGKIWEQNWEHDIEIKKGFMCWWEIVISESCFVLSVHKHTFIYPWRLDLVILVLNGFAHIWKPLLHVVVMPSLGNHLYSSTLHVLGAPLCGPSTTKSCIFTHSCQKIFWGALLEYDYMMGLTLIS